MQFNVQFEILADDRARALVNGVHAGYVRKLTKSGKTVAQYRGISATFSEPLRAQSRHFVPNYDCMSMAEIVTDRQLYANLVATVIRNAIRDQFDVIGVDPAHLPIRSNAA